MLPSVMLLLVGALVSFGDDLSETLQAMRDNARLYDNLDVEYVLTGEGDHVPEAVSPGGSEMSDWKTKCHLVFQGDMYFVSAQEAYDIRGGKSHQYTYELGFDGNTSRAAQDDTGNITDEPIPVMKYIPPHRWSFPQLQNHDAADFIAATGSVLKVYPDLHMNSSVVGREVVRGLECIKIRSIQTKGDSATPTGWFEFWVCPERNYLVAKSLQFVPESEKLPSSEAEVTEWQEYGPGVWLPSQAVCQNYNAFALRRGEHERILRQVYELKEAAFDPHHDIAFFRNVQMPEVGTILTLKGGELLSEETRVPRIATSGASTRWWFLIGNAVLIVAILVLALRKKFAQ